MKTILVPVDGTPVSESALPYAEVLARRTGGAVVVMHAAQLGSAWVHTSAAYTRAMRAAEDYVSRLATDLIERGIPTQTAVPFGAAAAWIRAEISLRGVDMVVMATHDRTGLRRLVNGSVAESVVAQAAAPVMLVRAAEGLRPAERFSQPHPVLVVPLDGSELAEAALPIAAELATACDGSVVLLGVVPTPGQLVAGEGAVMTPDEAEVQRMKEGAGEYLAQMKARFPPALWVETVVRLGAPGSQIAKEAEDRAAAAVVMATHGRTGLARSLLGSVAGDVMHQGTSPVVLVRPPALRSAEAAPALHESSASVAGA